MGIEEEIQQKTFENEYLKAHINLLFSSSWFLYKIFRWLEPYNISWHQFNLLRILRGKHPDPATVKEITDKMIDKMSNTSRLVEKLRRKKLVKRTRRKDDRRKVDVTITEQGLELLEEVSRVIESNVVNSMRSISEEEAETLNEILDKMRA